MSIISRTAGTWGRFVNAVNAGVVAWRQSDFQPTERAGWDEYPARLARYELFDNYYNNTAYSAIDRFAVGYKFQNGLYQHIRPIYNPVARLVKAYIAKVYGGTLNQQDMLTGAVPIEFGDDSQIAVIQSALLQVWRWSNWGVNKSLYVRYGALYGDSVIKIIDDRLKQRVMMEVVHPGKIKKLEFDAAHNVKFAEIEYSRTDPDTNKAFIYRELIDPYETVTFRDDEEFAYYYMPDGTPVSRWRNEYGFVPMVAAQHENMGLRWGANAFSTSLPKIDALNDTASLLNDQIRKSINVVWYFAGASGPQEIETRLDKRDSTPALYGPTGSEPKAMIADLDIPGALLNIDKMLAEIERDMPELSMHRLRESGNLTAPGVRSAYGDAIDRFVEARGNYDDSLARAQMMAMSIGGFRGYNGFEGITLDSYAAGSLNHVIADRPVISDSLTQKERIDLLLQSGAPPAAIWNELGFDEVTIADWKQQQSDNQAVTDQGLAAQISALANADRNA